MLSSYCSEKKSRKEKKHSAFGVPECCTPCDIPEPECPPFVLPTDITVNSARVGFLAVGSNEFNAIPFTPNPSVIILLNNLSRYSGANVEIVLTVQLISPPPFVASTTSTAIPLAGRGPLNLLVPPNIPSIGTIPVTFAPRILLAAVVTDLTGNAFEIAQIDTNGNIGLVDGFNPGPLNIHFFYTTTDRSVTRP